MIWITILFMTLNNPNLPIRINLSFFRNTGFQPLPYPFPRSRSAPIQNCAKRQKNWAITDLCHGYSVPLKYLIQPVLRKRNGRHLLVSLKILTALINLSVKFPYPLSLITLSKLLGSILRPVFIYRDIGNKMIGQKKRLC